MWQPLPQCKEPFPPRPALDESITARAKIILRPFPFEPDHVTQGGGADFLFFLCFFFLKKKKERKNFCPVHSEGAEATVMHGPPVGSIVRAERCCAIAAGAEARLRPVGSPGARSST